MRAGKIALSVASYGVVIVLLVLPLAQILAEALRHGLTAALVSLRDPDALAAIRLTLLVTLVTVALNTIGGVAAAWALTKYSFPGRRILTLLIELPISVSPVIAGLVWLLLFGRNGWWGFWLARHGIQIVFAVPGIILATLFVTFPYVARTVMPVLEQQGRDAEEAALLLGGGFWQILWRVTVPDARWGLVAGILLTTARAMGEFGAVSVVSGHIPGLTETMPLHIETLYNGYQTVAAFAMAALLALMGMAAVIARGFLDFRTKEIV